MKRSRIFEASPGTSSSSSATTWFANPARLSVLDLPDDVMSLVVRAWLRRCAEEWSYEIKSTAENLLHYAFDPERVLDGATSLARALRDVSALHRVLCECVRFPTAARLLGENKRLNDRWKYFLKQPWLAWIRLQTMMVPLKRVSKIAMRVHADLAHPNPMSPNFPRAFFCNCPVILGYRRVCRGLDEPPVATFLKMQWHFRGDLAPSPPVLDRRLLPRWLALRRLSDFPDREAELQKFEEFTGPKNLATDCGNCN